MAAPHELRRVDVVGAADQHGARVAENGHAVSVLVALGAQPVGQRSACRQRCQHRREQLCSGHVRRARRRRAAGRVGHETELLHRLVGRDRSRRRGRCGARPIVGVRQRRNTEPRALRVQHRQLRVDRVLVRQDIAGLFRGPARRGQHVGASLVRHDELRDLPIDCRCLRGRRDVGRGDVRGGGAIREAWLVSAVNPGWNGLGRDRRLWRAGAVSRRKR